MGFNNDGLREIGQRLMNRKQGSGVLIGANLGLGNGIPSSNSHLEFNVATDALADHVDFITINISSPNTPRLRDHHRAEELERLLTQVLAYRAERLSNSARKVPYFVKVSPDLDPILMRELGKQVLALGCEGIVATNTTTVREGLTSRQARQAGGLSGRPLYKKALQMVEILRDAVGSELAIIGVGGISSAEDALTMRRAGADLIQIYTGLVYRGPALIKEILDAIK